MTEVKKSLARRFGEAYGSIKAPINDIRKERMERREKELPIREKEMALKEREARLNARQAKLNKNSGGGAIGGIMNTLGQAFGPEQSGGKRSSRGGNTGPLIPNPLSDNPYGSPKPAHKKAKKSKSKGKSSGGQNIHIHIDK